MGGRSANRGQCAQPCRLPYELICDGRPCAMPPTRPATRYPLSPHDLAAYDRLPELIAAGVSALKIEGRLKPAEYVASVTRHYRTAIDAACRSRLPERAGRAAGEHTPGEPVQAGRPHHNLGPEEIAEMEVAFSRGFCHGWLDGPDHQALVSGQSSAKRGTLLGEVRGVRGERIVVELAGPIRRGDGVVFEGDRSREAEQGGRVYEVFQGRRSVEEAVAGGVVELAFRYGAIDRSKIRPRPEGLEDRRSAGGSPASQDLRRRPAAASRAGGSGDRGRGGKRLRVTATAATGAACRVESPSRCRRRSNIR